MTASNYFSSYFDEIGSQLHQVQFDDLDKVVLLCEALKTSGKKLIVAGNGGSAAIASHVAVDFTKAGNVRAVNFNEADLITCFANDYGYENWLSEALKAYADPGDVVFLISSSGQSENILRAASTAKTIGLSLVTFSGFSADNPLRLCGDYNFWVESNAYNVVEMTHHIWALAILDCMLDTKFS